MKALAAVILGAGIYAAFMSGQEKHLAHLYLENEEMKSSGAYIRVFMNVIPAAIFFYYRKLWRERWPDGYTLWLLMALGSFAAFTGVWVYSTAVDRVSLYFIPLQIAVFSALPVLLQGKINPKVTTFLVIAYYASVYFVWLNFATWASYWLPYQNLIFLD